MDSHSSWTISIHPEFDLELFLDRLPREQRPVLVDSLQNHLARFGNELAGTRWVTALGSGLFEFRLSGPQLLIRVFFTYERGKVILLLGAYDKKADSSPRRQQLEISKARKRLQKR